MKNNLNKETGYNNCTAYFRQDQHKKLGADVASRGNAFHWAQMDSQGTAAGLAHQMPFYQDQLRDKASGFLDKTVPWLTKKNGSMLFLYKEDTRKSLTLFS